MYKLPFPWRQLLLSGHQWTSEPGFGPCKTCKSAPMEEQIAHISLFVSEISIFVLLCIYKKKTNVLKLLDRQMDRLIIPTHDSWGKERFSFPPGESRIRANTTRKATREMVRGRVWWARRFPSLGGNKIKQGKLLQTAEQNLSPLCDLKKADNSTIWKAGISQGVVHF